MKRLLVIDPSTGRLGDYRIEELPQLVGPGDALVLNDAATLPASLRVDPELELRLVSADADGSFQAIAFGAGDFRQPTETRGAPRLLYEGERLRFSDELAARVLGFDPAQPRLVKLRFETSGAAFWSALYRHAKPIQYAYAQQPYALWDVQNVYAARPWAFELPSAGRPLTFETLFALEHRGAAVLHLTHAAGISSTGDADLDSRLPLPERYEIGAGTAAAIARCQAEQGRVIAVGTSVVRALEAQAQSSGGVAAGGGVTALRLNARYRPRVVDGLLSGIHEPGTSHFELLEAFAPRALLERAVDHAGRTGYVSHELGDSCLILPGALLERLAA